jgi:hypothetical protein
MSTRKRRRIKEEEDGEEDELISYAQEAAATATDDELPTISVSPPPGRPHARKQPRLFHHRPEEEDEEDEEDLPIIHKSHIRKRKRIVDDDDDDETNETAHDDDDHDDEDELLVVPQRRSQSKTVSITDKDVDDTDENYMVVVAPHTSELEADKLMKIVPVECRPVVSSASTPTLQDSEACMHWATREASVREGAQHEIYQRMLAQVGGDAMMVDMIKIVDAQEKERRARWVELLTRTFAWHDELIYEGRIGRHLSRNAIELRFDTSNKMTSKGGHCARRDNGKRFEIVLSTPVLAEAFSHGERTVLCNGLQFSNRLQCLQSVFEHESVHLAIFLFCPLEGVGMGGHTQMFKRIALRLFGQTAYKHGLKAGDAQENIERKATFRVGQRVSMLYKGATVIVQIIRINGKTASVFSPTCSGRVSFHLLRALD